MRRSSWKGLLCGAIVLVAGVPCLGQTSLPQQDGFPILNATGRYLGYGWSRRGYHAHGNGQLRVVRSNHPAHRYSSSSLSYMYQPGYRPHTSHSPQQPIMQTPTSAPAPPAIVPSPSIRVPAPADPITPMQVAPKQLEAPTLRLPKREEVPAEELLMPEELKPQEQEQQRRTFLKPPAPLPEEDPDMLLDPSEGSLEDSSPSDLGSPAPLPPTGEKELPAVAPSIAPEDPQLPVAPPGAESAPIEKSLDQRIEEQLGPKVPAEEMLLEEADGGLQLSPDEADELLRMNDFSGRRSSSVPSLLPAHYQVQQRPEELRWTPRNESHGRPPSWGTSKNASYFIRPSPGRSQVMWREVQRRSIHLRP